jgi:hypothetical protein
MIHINDIIEFVDQLMPKIENCGPLHIHSISGIKSEDTKITGLDKIKLKKLLEQEIWNFTKTVKF